jgi:HAD superfamily hydrolase (TIGR01509 family)
MEGVIFDLDGTLLDTETISGLSIQRVLKEHGQEEFPFELRKKLLGRPSGEWTRMVIDALDLHDRLVPEEFTHLWELYMKEMYSEVTPMEGAYELVRKLRYEYNVPIALATSSSSHAVSLKRQLHEEMFQCFDVIVCGDDPAIQRGKPAPDIFQIAAQRLGKASNCIVFEDAVTGVTAGKAAGMRVIAIPDARFHSEEEKQLYFSHADVILSSLSEFLPVEHGLLTL